MTFSSECYIFFPGGFGTFDELFSILTLLQTKKIPAVPVILFGKDFWIPAVELIKKQMLDVHHTIEDEDMNLFRVTDSMDAVIKTIKGAPVSEWWKMMD
jgi:predicted Rossmann-fold nucleotide-binding protein